MHSRLVFVSIFIFRFVSGMYSVMWYIGTDMPPKVPKTFFLDGVCLSETGLNQIRELSLKFAEKKQKPRWRRNPSASTHPALLMMMSMSEKSEDDQENMDSKTTTMGRC